MAPRRSRSFTGRSSAHGWTSRRPARSARRRGEAQLRPPIAHLNNRQAHRIILPRIIQIEMQCDGGKVHDETANYADLSGNPDSVCKRIAQARRHWSLQNVARSCVADSDATCAIAEK